MLWLLAACAPPSSSPVATDRPAVLGSTIEVQATPICNTIRRTPFRRYTDDAWDAQFTSAGSSRFMVGSGVGVADIDQDGFKDILLPKNGAVSLWYGDGAGGMTNEVLLANEGQFTAAVPVDYDGDGDLDIYLSRYDGPDQLLQNDRGSGFHDVAAKAGIGSHAFGIGSSWADMDGDGDLDLLVLKHGDWLSEHSDISHIYEAQGDGTFIDVTAKHWTGDQGFGHTLAGGFIDLDQDGLPEIYLVNDYGWILPNQMFWNRPEGFVEAGPRVGLNRRMCGMGYATADIDGDDVPDLFHSAWLELRMLSTYGTGSWIDFTLPAGFRIEEHLQRHVAWGADFGDIDNDGDEDLWIGFGGISANIDNPFFQPDALYIREPERFVEQAGAWGIADFRRTRGGLLVDIDGDGWLDLIKRNKDGLPELAFANCGEANWLEIELRDNGGNTRAIGASVRVIDGEHDAIRWMRAGGRSLASGGPAELHFGLGERKAVDVEVTWPDGAIESFDAVDANQRILIRR